MTATRTLKWFLDRIGKRIWRRSNGCACKPCRTVTRDGLVPFDRRHARYLFDCQGEFEIAYYDAKPKGG